MGSNRKDGGSSKVDLRKQISEIFAKNAHQPDGGGDAMAALMARLEKADMSGEQSRKVMRMILADWRASLARINAYLDSLHGRD